MSENRRQRRADAARVRSQPFSKDHLEAVVYWCHYRLLGKSTYPDAPVDGKPLNWVSDHASKLTAMLRDETAHDWDESALWPRLVALSKSTPLQMKYRAQAHWFELAMPRVTMDANLAASLMCMKVSQAILADFRPPFDSLQITIPPDLIFMVRADGVLVPVVRALFARVSDDSGLLNWCLFADEATGCGTLHRWNVEIGTIAGCLPWNGTEAEAPNPFSADLQDIDRRSQDLLGVLAKRRAARTPHGSGAKGRPRLATSN